MRRAHAQRPSHPSQSKAFNEFTSEWATFLSSAKYGFFDEKFAQSRYPLTADSVDESDYLRRPSLEHLLLEKIHARNDVVILGNEGSGKTTLLHYVLGHLSFRDARKPIVRAYVDVKRFSPTGDFEKFVFRSVYEQLDREKDYNGRPLTEVWAGWITDICADPRINAYFEAIGGRYGLPSLLAFVSAKHDHKPFYIALDNADPMTSELLRDVVKAVEEAREKAMAIRALQGGPRKLTASFIIACRHSTWHAIGNAAWGDLPFQNPEIISIPPVDDNVWSITKAFVRTRLRSADQEGRLRGMFMQIPVAESVTVTETRPLAEILCRIADWIHQKTPEPERLIGGFSCQSIRRSKMFALKVLGHAIVVQSWLAEEQQRHVHTSETAAELMREAVFDVVQSIGEGVSAAEVLMNPFNVVELGNRRENPFIGLTMMRLLRKHWGEIHSKASTEEEIYFGTIFDNLRAIGYGDAAIQSCVRTFCIASVLRPIVSQHALLRGDQLSTVYERYLLDKDAFDLYWSLIFRTGRDRHTEAASKGNAILFMNACTRSNYGVGYAERPINALYRAFVNVRFLKDCLEQGDYRLRDLCARNGYNSPLEGYVADIFPSLQRTWRGTLTDKARIMGPSTRPIDREMLDETEENLAFLERTWRRGGMPKLVAG